MINSCVDSPSYLPSESKIHWSFGHQQTQVIQRPEDTKAVRPPLVGVIKSSDCKFNKRGSLAINISCATFIARLQILFIILKIRNSICKVNVVITFYQVNSFTFLFNCSILLKNFKERLV
ncbi:hypothetical protein PGT21_011588 [Puccinia graminis f. sp. tritici]|uniref:Uncharacterized protein n=1 Tax=Puccinia graminis f. sp. tritici TaxID=56615 RepID=A0A5B0Q3A9_PUCGR|nr:hypothetical protein PGT21_011588 [Puccinia graminis f. sp. tritici]